MGEISLIQSNPVKVSSFQCGLDVLFSMGREMIVIQWNMLFSIEGEISLIQSNPVKVPSFQHGL